MNPSPPVLIRLFGTPSLERGDGTPVTGRAAQRHRIALLALLALTPGRRIGREKAMALLWPEADGDRARKLLNVSVYELRSALGDELLVTAGDELRLGDGVRVDVGEFEAAAGAGDHARAAEWHAGPFLDGFFLPDAAAFEEWSDRERQRLAGLHGRSLEALAEAAESAGDHAGAVERWRARAAHDPWDSRVALRLMRALEASGNRAAAIQHADAHARRLREELGADAGDVLAEAAALRTKVAGTPSLSAPRPSPSAPLELPGIPVPARRSRRTLAAAAALALSLALAAWIALGRGAPPARSIVVLPFANLSGSGERDYFSDGLTDEIITGLATVPGLTVIGRTSAMRYASSVATIPEIARELGVAHVMHGTLRREGNRARVTAQLVEAARERVLWANTYDSELDDTLGVQERIARDVVRALELEFRGDSGAQIVRRGTRNAAALEAYQRGRFHWNRRTKSDVVAAIAYFERAIAADSAYGDAYSGLADALLVQWQLGHVNTPEEEVRRRYVWAAERAISLDDASADAHTSFATALWWQGNWPGAEREFRRAIALNPNHSGALHWYSLLLPGFGRLDEARRMSRRSLDLDPYAPMTVVSYSWLSTLVGDWEGALEYATRALELNPEWVGGHMLKARAHAYLGGRDEAVASARKALELMPDATRLAELAFVHAKVGERQAAREVLARVRGIAPADAGVLARALVALGERDSALAVLEQHASWTWPHRTTIYEPGLEPLRDDPRMEALRLRIEREMGVR
ncbi:MAG TPA: BTAD domain-containing putative transcriptional regulator [Gemmatimonadales bacterium]